MSLIAILFWLLLILSALGSFADQPWVARPSRLVLLLLIGLLGWRVFPIS